MPEREEHLVDATLPAPLAVAGGPPEGVDQPAAPVPAPLRAREALAALRDPALDQLPGRRAGQPGADAPGYLVALDRGKGRRPEVRGVDDAAVMRGPVPPGGCRSGERKRRQRGERDQDEKTGPSPCQGHRAAKL